MDTRAPDEGHYVFGSFRVDPAERTLARDGASVPLTYRVFEALLALVRSPGHLLTKDELMDSVWPGRIVDEGSLTQAIFTLRKALGDEGRYIVTIPGQGYSFNAPVQAVPGPTTDEAIRQALTGAKPTRTAEPSALPTQQSGSRAGYLAAIGVLAIVAAGAFFVIRNKAAAPVIGKPIVVVVADFQSLSGDAQFDKTFATVTRIDLHQSPYLSVLSQSVVEDTLDLMGRPKDTPVTPALAQEVCARNNGQVAISGNVAQVGAKYLLAMTATDCVGGKDITVEKAEVADRDALLPTLDKLVGGIREKLGEPTASIEKFNVPMLQKHTGSLEALRAYSEAYYEFNRGKNFEAIALYKRAIEIDPKFAIAYADLSAVYSNLTETKLDIDNITKAYALRDYASELDKLYISLRYNESVTGNMYEVIRILRAWAELYPNDANARANLSNRENWMGQYAAAIQDGKVALALNTKAEGPYVVLARAYIHSGQFDAAAAILARSIANHLDGYDTHRLLIQIAFARGDLAGVQRQMDWAAGKPAERVMLIDAGQIAFSEGQVHRGLDLFARALELGKSYGLSNIFAAPNARLLNALGEKDLALQSLSEVPAGYDSPDYRFILAAIGDEAKAQALVHDDLAKSPSNTLLNEAYAPEVRAALALRHGQPQAAIDALKPAAAIEMRTLDIPYLRGLAYLAAKDGARAAVEFKKVLDNPGVDAVSPYLPLGELGYARALHMQGKLEESRTAYLKLFSLWKNADADLPPLQDAKREYAQLPAA